MPRQGRVQSEGAFYHIFNRGANKANIYFDDMDRRVFIRYLAENSLKYKIRIYSYCLMANHYHLFLQTGLANLARFMQHIQGSYAQFVNLKYSRAGCLFQGRYQSRLIDSAAYSLEIIRYIHLNPVEAGEVECPEDYRWSSYPVYLGKINHNGWFDTQWALSLFSNPKNDGVETFKVFHRTSARGV